MHGRLEASGPQFASMHSREKQNCREQDLNQTKTGHTDAKASGCNNMGNRLFITIVVEL